jgi:hypothetical protein
MNANAEKNGMWAILNESSSNYGWITSIFFVILHNDFQRELHQLPGQVQITRDKTSTSSL